MIEVILIKFGGSLITDKKRPYTARKATIRRLAREISDVLKNNKEVKLVLGNGSGSFAHTSAAKYKTADGYSNDEGQFGFCVVQNDAIRINRICVEQFLKEEINVIGVSPNNIMQTEQKKLTKVYISNIEEMLKRGIIPFVYGDTVLDKKTGSCIYSCDQVIEVLADKLNKKKFLVKKIISVGDFPGVIDENEKIIPKIDKKIFEKLIENGAIKQSDKTDVTGGMKAKIETLLSETEKGRQSLIVDGRKRGNLTKAILGKMFLGTTISN